jgi:outer membrane lipoprotein-sorting protein
MFRYLIAIVCITTSVAMAQTAQDKGLKIVTENKTVNDGFGGESSQMTMVLINAHGDQTVRKMTSVSTEVKGDGDRSRIEFIQPADVKGTRMLTWSHGTKNDDQWLFLPSLKRVKRISSRSKSGSFMGSEFAYEDLGSQEIEKYTYTYLKDETINERPHWVIEQIPTDKKSGYSKQVSWIDQGYRQPSKIDFYDRKGAHLKTFTFTGYTQFDKWWRAGQIAALNHQTQKRSTLTWNNRKLGQTADADVFTKDGLKDF